MLKDTWCRYEGIYVASSQWSAVSSTFHVHILGRETGFERGAGWSKVKKKRGVCIYIIQGVSENMQQLIASTKIMS